ncbi:hypothetical protein BC826DRAFT_1091415 [Russula brevipes]|nr:hypothetical protein BC826DRAFT_1091415 [Russula brevipes]
MAPSQQIFSTSLTRLFNVRHPVMLRSTDMMNVASGLRLAAAVTNAGSGIGVIGGINHSPKMPREGIDDLKSQLEDQGATFGTDLTISQIGGGACKTNGRLSELTDVIIEKKAAVFVYAAGVPPKDMVDKLHAAGIVVMNMIGHLKHVKKALNQERRGDMPFSILVPSVVDLWRGREKPLDRGARHRRRSWGELPRRSSPTAPRGFWVGTRFFFVASEEVRRAAFCCTQVARLCRAGYDDMVKTLGVQRPTRRPPHVRKTEYVRETESLNGCSGPLSLSREENRRQEMSELVAAGRIPHQIEMHEHPEKLLDGCAAASLKDIKPVKEIVYELVTTVTQCLAYAHGMIGPQAKL